MNKAPKWPMSYHLYFRNQIFKTGVFLTVVLLFKCSNFVLKMERTNHRKSAKYDILMLQFLNTCYGNIKTDIKTVNRVFDVDSAILYKVCILQSGSQRWNGPSLTSFSLSLDFILKIESDFFAK